MKEKILVIGALGKIGQAVVAQLTRKGYEVLQNDIKFSHNHSIDSADIVVTCLPAGIAYNELGNILTASKNKKIIDVSYMEEDVYTLQNLVLKGGHTLIPDAGLAPGLTNLLVGHRLSIDSYIETANLYVGGVTTEKRKVYEVQDTWNIGDLESEYKRPARFIDRGMRAVISPLDTCEKVDLPGIGEMEAFISDGCRTLLRNIKPYEMKECTLRWPGHIDQIRKAINNNKFNEFNIVSSNNDLVVLYCEINNYKYFMIDKFTAPFSAMQRTTGFTTAKFAEWATENHYLFKAGIYSPEEIGKNINAFKFITNQFNIWETRNFNFQ